MFFLVIHDEIWFHLEDLGRSWEIECVWSVDGAFRTTPFDQVGTRKRTSWACGGASLWISDIVQGSCDIQAMDSSLHVRANRSFLSLRVAQDRPRRPGNTDNTMETAHTPPSIPKHMYITIMILSIQPFISCRLCLLPRIVRISSSPPWIYCSGVFSRSFIRCLPLSFSYARFNCKHTSRSVDS